MHTYHPNRLVKSHEDALAYVGKKIVNAMAQIRTTQKSSVTDNGDVLFPLLRAELSKDLRKIDGDKKGLDTRKIEITSSEKNSTKLWIRLEGIPYEIHVVAGIPTWRSDQRKKYACSVQEITGQGELDLGATYPHGKMFIEVSLTPDPYECQVNLVLMTNHNHSSNRKNEEIIGIARIDELELAVQSLPESEATNEDEFRNFMMPRDDSDEAYNADSEQKENQHHERNTNDEEGKTA